MTRLWRYATSVAVVALGGWQENAAFFYRGYHNRGYLMWGLCTELDFLHVMNEGAVDVCRESLCVYT
jgi:hypothetical protein